MKCANGCAICSPLTVTSCLSCMPAYFFSNNTVCLKCSTGCLSCTSNTSCTNCDSSYTISNRSCLPKIPFPCASTSAAGCQSCAAGFKLDSTGNCAFDFSCNASKNCKTCPDSTYLQNGSCTNCPIIANCSICNPSGVGCAVCNKGYYVSNNVCTPCLTGCSHCQS